MKKSLLSTHHVPPKFFTYDRLPSSNSLSWSELCSLLNEHVSTSSGSKSENPLILGTRNLFIFYTGGYSCRLLRVYFFLFKLFFFRTCSCNVEYQDFLYVLYHCPRFVQSYFWYISPLSLINKIWKEEKSWQLP